MIASFLANEKMLIFIGLLIGAVVIYFVFRTTDVEKESNTLANSLEKQLSELKKKGITPRMSTEQAKTWCKRMYESAGVLDDDETTIFTLGGLIANKADGLLVQIQFQKMYEKDLRTFVKDALSDSEIAIWNNKTSSKGLGV